MNVNTNAEGENNTLPVDCLAGKKSSSSEVLISKLHETIIDMNVWISVRYLTLLRCLTGLADGCTDGNRDQQEKRKVVRSTKQGKHLVWRNLFWKTRDQQRSGEAVV